MNRGSTFALLACAAMTVGCASHAKVVKFNKEDGSGTVAIPANTDEWPTHYRRAAEELIEKQVGPSYRIVSEGEFVQGKRKQLTPDSNAASFTQEKITEYRISFVRVPGPVVPSVTPEGAGLIPTGGPGQVPPPGTMPGALPGAALQPGMTSTSIYRPVVSTTNIYRPVLTGPDCFH
jgi:hypothetical protein